MLHQIREALRMMTNNTPSGVTRARTAAALLIGLALAAALLSIAGCSGTEETPQATEEEPKGFGMGGVDQPIAILASVIEDVPEPWDLGTPESAVRSYLDWVGYAYRTAESEVASPTQSAYQLVRTDAYIQANIQEQKLLDQTLVSLTLGEPSIEGSTAVVPAEEEWSYRYVSIVEAGKTISGPHTAKYKTTYTLEKTDNGWVVDNIEVEQIGDVE